MRLRQLSVIAGSMCLRHDRTPPHACSVRAFRGGDRDPLPWLMQTGHCNRSSANVRRGRGNWPPPWHRSLARHTRTHCQREQRAPSCPRRTRVTTTVWVVSQPAKSTTISGSRNLQSYAERGIAVHLQHAAKLHWLDWCAWPVK
jgi:hypothetical protein